MERTSNQPTFLDSLTSDLGGRRTSKFFRKCNELIPWNELAEPLKDMYKNNKRTNKIKPFKDAIRFLQQIFRYKKT